MSKSHAPAEVLPGISVREAMISDVAPIAEVWRAAWLDGHRGQVPEALLAARGPDYFAAQAAAKLTSALVATDSSGRVVGVAITAVDELFQLAVDRAARNRGAGAALLRAAEERIIADEHAQAWLAVVPGNTRARDFYARHGWQDTGPVTYDAPAATGSIPVPVHRYVKELAHGALA